MQKLVCRIITLIILIAGLSTSPVGKTIFAQEPPNQQSKSIRPSSNHSLASM